MYIVVLVTVPAQSKAQEISRFIISKKLCACVNIIPRVDSFFWWQGKVDRAKEVLLVIKTKKSLFGKLAKAVKLKHPYKVPEIIGLPIACGNKDYLEWINESCR